MKLAQYGIEPGTHVLTIRSVEPVIVKGQFHRQRWNYVSADGVPYTEHTTPSGGRGSNARTIAEAAIGSDLTEVETDDLPGRRLTARIVPFPSAEFDWRLRIAEVRSLDGQFGGLIRGESGTTIDRLIELAQETPS